MTELKTRKEALELIYAKWHPVQSVETVGIEDCAGRVLAENVYAMYNIPVVRSSAMDGIAVKSSDFYNEETGEELIPDTSEWTAGVDYARADTGDDFDDAFDAVIQIEKVIFDENGKISIDLSAAAHAYRKADGPLKVRKNTNVRPAGSSVKQGSLQAEQGCIIRPEDIANIAMSGVSEVKVVKKPRVVFIPTGSELVPAGTPLERGQNYNSNAPMVKAMLTELGAEAICYPIVKDKKNELKAALERALEEGDIVLINGGSSKGEEDFNSHLLEEMGEMLFHGLAAVPGKPMGAAVINGKPVINLSGPALASYFGVHWCASALVNMMLGIKERKVHKVKVTLAEDLDTPAHMESLVRLNIVQNEDGTYLGYPVPHVNRGMTPAMQANGMFASEIGTGLYPAGTEIEVEVR